MMQLLSENSQWPQAVNYFRKKALSQMFDWILNTPLDQTFVAATQLNSYITKLNMTNTYMC